MPTVQSTYSKYLTNGKAGKLERIELSNRISGITETDDLEFGVPVTHGTNDNQIRATKAGDTFILGITYMDASTKPDADDKHKQYSDVGLITKGLIWVEVGEAVAPGDPVYVVVATGAYMKSNASGRVQLLGGRFASTAAASGDLALLRLG